MTLPREPAGRGGWRGVPKVRVSDAIAEYFTSNTTGSGYDLYSYYKAMATAQPLASARKKAESKIRKRMVRDKRAAAKVLGRIQGQKSVPGRGRAKIELYDEDVAIELEAYLKKHPLRSTRKVMSYNSFMHYLWIAKKLDYLDYVYQSDDTAVTEPAHPSRSGTETSEWHDDNPRVAFQIGGRGREALAGIDLYGEYGHRSH